MDSIQFPYHIRLPKYMGQAIREVRKEKKMTQEDLADITGTSMKFISNVEQGKASVQMDKVIDLTRALGLQIYLTREQGPGKENSNE